MSCRCAGRVGRDGGEAGRTPRVEGRSHKQGAGRQAPRFQGKAWTRSGWGGPDDGPLGGGGSGRRPGGTGAPKRVSAPAQVELEEAVVRRQAAGRTLGQTVRLWAVRALLNLLVLALLGAAFYGVYWATGYTVQLQVRDPRSREGCGGAGYEGTRGLSSCAPCSRRRRPWCSRRRCCSSWSTSCRPRSSRPSTSCCPRCSSSSPPWRATRGAARSSSSC